MRTCLVVMTLLVMIVGCTPQPNPPEKEVETIGLGDSALKKFASQDDLESYFSGQMVRTNERFADGPVVADDAEDVDGGAAPSAPGSQTDGVNNDPSYDHDGTAVGAEPIGSDDGRDHSGTTTQEQGVDEADVVKTDGEYIYIIHEQKLRVVKALPLTEMSEVANLDVEGYGQDIYLMGDKIVAMSSTWGQYVYSDVDNGVVPPPMDDGVATGGEDSASVPGNPGMDGEPDSAPLPTEPDSTGQIGDDAGDEDDEPVVGIDLPSVSPHGPMTYQRPSTIVTIIDVSDKASLALVSKTKIEGTLSTSRMIDGVLHLVVSNHPGFYFDVFPMMGRAEFDESDVRSELILPKFEQFDANGVTREGDLLTWEDVWRPAEPDGFGIVSLVSLAVDSPEAFKAVGLVAEPGLVYSSTKALYLTNTNWTWLGTESQSRETTDVYKFAYVDNGTEPVAAGRVDGRILNQYSMGEYEGFLRLATSTFANFFEGPEAESTNAVYVLEQAGDSLDIVGSIENIAPGETIQSARFMGDRGFVVTFEQIDPLFTLDMTDPRNPAIVGELKVPGFSTFLIPMDENNLLAVGQYVPEEGERWIRGVQLSIFDISDYANPVQKHNLVLGEESGAWSEALFSPKAFTYYAEQSLVALPVAIYPPQPDFGFFDEFGKILIEIMEEEFQIDLNEDYDPAELEALLEGKSDQELEELAVSMMTEAMMQLVLRGELDVADIEELMSGFDGNGFWTDVTGNAEQGAEPREDGEMDNFLDALIGTVEGNSFEGLIVYDVSPDAGFSELGRISTRPVGDDYWYHWTAFTRTIFTQDHAFAVTNHGVSGVPLANFEALSEVAFEVDPPDWGGHIDVPFAVDDFEIVETDTVP